MCNVDVRAPTGFMRSRQCGRAWLGGRRGRGGGWKQCLSRRITNAGGGSGLLIIARCRGVSGAGSRGQELRRRARTGRRPTRRGWAAAQYRGGAGVAGVLG